MVNLNPFPCNFVIAIFFYCICECVPFTPDLLYLFDSVFSFDDFDAILIVYLLLHSEQAMPQNYPGLETLNFICVTFSTLQQRCLWRLRKPTVNKLTKFKIHHSKSFTSWIIPTAKIPFSYQISWYIHRAKLLSNGFKLFRSIRYFLPHFIIPQRIEFQFNRYTFTISIVFISFRFRFYCSQGRW